MHAVAGGEWIGSKKNMMRTEEDQKHNGFYMQ